MTARLFWALLALPTAAALAETDTTDPQRSAAPQPQGLPPPVPTEPMAQESTDGAADWDLEERIAAVNDGDLHFLPPEATARAHRHANRIRIDRASLRGGWIRLEQCHDRLDPVPAAQVTFNPERIRHLRVTEVQGIARAWVEGHTVQLEGVEPGARLCIAGESRALKPMGEGRWRLENGPYMRRFLDGYYPLHVVLEVEWPADVLGFAAASPAPQPGFSVDPGSGRLRVDATFEGRLKTCLDFGSAEAKTDPRVRLEPLPPCPR